jgi:hypothetical protein
MAGVPYLCRVLVIMEFTCFIWVIWAQRWNWLVERQIEGWNYIENPILPQKSWRPIIIFHVKIATNIGVYTQCLGTPISAYWIYWLSIIQLVSWCVCIYGMLPVLKNVPFPFDDGLPSQEKRRAPWPRRFCNLAGRPLKQNRKRSKARDRQRQRRFFHLQWRFQAIPCSFVWGEWWFTYILPSGYLT